MVGGVGFEFTTPTVCVCMRADITLFIVLRYCILLFVIGTLTGLDFILLHFGVCCNLFNGMETKRRPDFR